MSDKSSSLYSNVYTKKFTLKAFSFKPASNPEPGKPEESINSDASDSEPDERPQGFLRDRRKKIRLDDNLNSPDVQIVETSPGNSSDIYEGFGKVEETFTCSGDAPKRKLRTRKIEKIQQDHEENARFKVQALAQLDQLLTKKNILSDRSSHHDSGFVDLIDCNAIPSVDTMTVKLRWKGEIRKFSHQKTEPFHTIVKKLAESEGVNTDRIVIFRGEEEIQHSFTPVSVGLKVHHILDGGISSESRTEKASSSSTKTQNEDVITLKMQTKTSKHAVSVEIHKREPMQVLVERYAKIQSISPSSVRLMFDGEGVSLTDTPDDLELEGGECIDVFVQ